MFKNSLILTALKITKEFPGVKALSNVDIGIKRGTVHALVGANGAGKSTLMNILSGLDKNYSGEILINGEKIKFRSVYDAIKKGVSMIHQELNYIPYMTIAENIFLGRELSSKIPFFHK